MNRFECEWATAKRLLFLGPIINTWDTGVKVILEFRYRKERRRKLWKVCMYPSKGQVKREREEQNWEERVGTNQRLLFFFFFSSLLSPIFLLSLHPFFAPKWVRKGKREEFEGMLVGAREGGGKREKWMNRGRYVSTRMTLQEILFSLSLSNSSSPLFSSLFSSFHTNIFHSNLPPLHTFFSIPLSPFLFNHTHGPQWMLHNTQ